MYVQAQAHATPAALERTQAGPRLVLLAAERDADPVGVLELNSKRINVNGFPGKSLINGFNKS